jgi:hypothetical protein
VGQSHGNPQGEMPNCQPIGFNTWRMALERHGQEWIRTTEDVKPADLQHASGNCPAPLAAYSVKGYSQSAWRVPKGLLRTRLIYVFEGKKNETHHCSLPFFNPII